MNKYSQCGEEKLLVNLFVKIGLKFNRVLEFGAGDGKMYSNTRLLIENGCTGILWDAEPKAPEVKREFVTKDNINDLFKSYNIYNRLDLCSIDIDGNDYWVWKELKYRPRVVIIEYNSAFGNNSVTIPYDEKHTWDGTTFYGASASALIKLAGEKGYTLVDATGLNLIFVINEELSPELINKNIIINTEPGHRPDALNRELIQI